MTSQQLKHELISWLTKLKDKKLLNSLASFKDYVESGDWYSKLYTKQKKSLERGIRDHIKGNTLTSQQFWH